MSRPPPFRVSVHRTGTDGISVLRVVGEVDLLTVPALVGALDQVLAPGHRAALIDLTAMTFCSVRGGQALVDAENRARRTRTGFILLGLAPEVGRLLSLGRAGDSFAPARRPPPTRHGPRER